MTRGSRAVELGRATLVAALVALVAGCSSGGSPPPAPAGDAQLSQGREVYADHCARCHGSGGAGGAGPRLAGTEIDLGVVRSGRRGMPAFGQRLSDEELDAVAAYIADGL